MLAPSWAQVGPSWVQVGPKLANVSPSWAKLFQVGSEYGPNWCQDGLKLAHVGSCWRQFASREQPRATQVAPKRVQIRLHIDTKTKFALKDKFSSVLKAIFACLQSKKTTPKQRKIKLEKASNFASNSGMFSFHFLPC